MRQIDLEIARKSAIFLDSSVEIQTLKQEKQQIAFLMVEAGAEIRRKLDSEIKNSEIWQQNIAAETANLKSQLERWSAVSSDYNNLLQQLTVANNKLNEFILQKDALLIEAAQQDTTKRRSFNRSCSTRSTMATFDSSYRTTNKKYRYY